MKRREFITKSLLVAAGTTFLNSCDLLFKNKKKNLNNKVVTRKFKNLDIPLLGFGCMRLPKTLEGQIDLSHFEKMADYAIQHGVNYFDSAYMYHGGESERAVGTILRNYKRDSFFLATKNPLYSLTSREDVRTIFEEQLKKCQVTYFDFYLAHNVSERSIDKFRSFNVYEELNKLKQEGKIRNLGFSYHGGPAILNEVANEYPWDFIQMQLNYLDWTSREASSNYAILEKANIPVISMTPLRGGALTNLSGSAKAVLTDEAPNDTQASFGLRWVTGRKNVFTVLSGMSSLEQVQENVTTFTDFRTFTKEEELIAEKISSILQKQGEINCTACNYCYECPRAIPIPTIFTLYNEYKTDYDAKAFLQKYDQLKEREKADKCIKCGLCNANCPQLLEIPELLETVDNTVKSLRKGAV